MRANLLIALITCLLSTAGCKHTSVAASSAAPPPTSDKAVSPQPAAGFVRATGTVQAVRAFTVQAPQIVGQGRMTLVKFVKNGVRVNEGDVLAEFDRTQQLDAARDAQARYEDLTHQVRQKTAQNRSEAEKRVSQLKEAEAELAKAQIQLRKGPILNEIDRLKNEARAEAARAKVESLKKSNHFREVAGAAALRILELQMQRQQVALERARSNAEKLLVRARIGGMVALENTWRSGSQGNLQEGDQVWPGQSMVKIFDPAEMEVAAVIGEPEGAVLRPGAKALVRLDAYPETAFPAHLISASPVATAAIGSPIKNFTARFRIEQTDPRLMPDLSAAVVIQRESGQP